MPIQEGMKQLFVSDNLWRRIEPHVPAHKPHLKGGRKPKADRGCLEGMLFVLKTGIQWEHLPQELGWGSGMTCWRRMRDWQAAGCGTASKRSFSPSFVRATTWT